MNVHEAVWFALSVAKYVIEGLSFTGRYGVTTWNLWNALHSTWISSIKITMEFCTGLDNDVFLECLEFRSNSVDTIWVIIKQYLKLCNLGSNFFGEPVTGSSQITLMVFH